MQRSYISKSPLFAGDSRVFLGVSLAIVAFAGAASASPITLSPVAIGFNSPISVDYHQPTNSLILSTNYSSGSPYNFELVDPSGARAQFSALSGLTDEIYIAAARSNANGFIAGQSYTGNGLPGQIDRISPDGSVVTNAWVDLNALFGEAGLLRGALHIDTTGDWGGDLIVATTTGNVYRITSAGAATFVGTASHIIEGITTVPNDPSRYGAWAGKILAGSDDTELYTFDNAGNLTVFNLGFSSTENLNIPNAGDVFYGVDFAGSTLWAANSPQWVPYVGDVILGEESGDLWDIKWNAVTATFDKTLLTHVSQWEGATFAPTLLPGVIPEPATLGLLGLGLAGLGLRRRNRG